MQLSTVAIAFTSLIATVLASECRDANKVVSNCCWGGKSPKDDWPKANFEACVRQLKYHPGWDVERTQCEHEKPNFCSENGVTQAECTADCCDTITKYGVGCPKK